MSWLHLALKFLHESVRYVIPPSVINQTVKLSHCPLLTCSFYHFQGKIINRPLAGTVRRGKTEKEDLMQEQQLLSDEKQCAEHIMLVDLGRNDVGKVGCLHTFRLCICLATMSPSDLLHCIIKAISLLSN